MQHFSRLSLPFVCLIVLAGCDPAPTANTKSPAQKSIEADIGQVEEDVRLAAANKRIDELERQVAELQATPEKLDLQMLSKRVDLLEAVTQGSAAGQTRADTTDLSDAKPNAKPPSQSSGATPTAPRRSANPLLQTPDTQTRLATPEEAKAFLRKQ
jgi:TolA-binding protein